MVWIVAAGSVSVPLSAQCRVPFHVGEVLRYSAWFNFIKGGQSTLEIVGRDTLNDYVTYHIRSRTVSTPFFDRFYKVRDQMETWIDCDSLYSHRFRKSLVEGRYRQKYAVTFDYARGYAFSSSDTVALKKRVHDALSIFYYFRSESLAVGKVIEVNNFDNDKFKPFKVRVEKIETIAVPAGDISCFVLLPYVEKGSLFKHKSDVTVYISRDARRLPVMISNDARFGSLILKLESYPD